ncbi:MAG: PepSY domain-containing protein [Candidatus Contendobacter sp.]|nr:PepSY domain-containing protein [Candidatus Contendobacter sp.]MDG4557468.1 PepSY domain-containing protein [Candidatus Contendobacter sp.]
MHRTAGPAAVLLLAAGLLASSQVDAGRDQEEIRRLRGAGRIVSLETIIANHRRQYPGGQLLEAELEFERNRYVYELKMLGDDGVVREFEYDAGTGELWRIERKEERKE